MIARFHSPPHVKRRRKRRAGGQLHDARLRLTRTDKSGRQRRHRQIDGDGVIVSDEQFQVVLGPGKAQTAMMNGLLERQHPPPRADAGRRRGRKQAGKQTSVQKSSPIIHQR